MSPISDWWFDTERARCVSVAGYYPGTVGMRPWAYSLYVGIKASRRSLQFCPWCSSPLFPFKSQDFFICVRHGDVTAEFLEHYGHLEARNALIEMRAWQAHDAIRAMADIAAMRVDAVLGRCRTPFQSTAMQMVRDMRGQWIRAS